jgi:serine protease AprX
MIPKMKDFSIRLFLCCIFLMPVHAFSQNKYWVFFTDKNGVSFDPYTYFSAEAINRRLQQGIPLVDETDKPVNQNYIDQISAYCDSLSYPTRWFNGIAVYSDNERMEKIKTFSFVKSTEPMQVMIPELAEADYFSKDEGLEKLAIAQIKRMEGEWFRNNGFTGKGIKIAIIDGGFTGLKQGMYERDEFFKDIKITSTYDFISKTEDVFRKNEHGKTVLGCIAGRADSVWLGMAPDAEFLLARTAKNFSEGTKDEECWLAAVEWCDKNGANIINTSLGYDVAKYFQNDMDGKTSLISRSANLASKKGILVVVAAGNEGQSYWKKICTPADADSVLTVGAINPYSGIQASWSSYGPSADFRLKPEVSAYGYVAAVYDRTIGEMMGTSFASPLVAGFAACVMQMHPEWTCMRVKEEIQKSADLFPYFDYAHGNGVPQASYFFDVVSEDKETFIIEEDTAGNSFSVVIKDEYYMYNVPFIPNYYDIKSKQKEDEENGDPENPVLPSLHINDDQMSHYASSIYTAQPDYLFYHIENTSGYLDKYFVIAIEEKKVVTLHSYEFEKGSRIRFYYKGHVKTKVIE